MEKQGTEIQEIKQKIDGINEDREYTNIASLGASVGCLLSLACHSLFSKSITGFELLLGCVLPYAFLFLMFVFWGRMFLLYRKKKRLKKELGKLLKAKLG